MTDSTDFEASGRSEYIGLVLLSVLIRENPWPVKVRGLFVLSFRLFLDLGWEFRKGFED
jgi:hypothetical protein